ncbi:sel1 repeat family protein [Grimontia sp. NTOU-MAR1]|uniref:sel1 repeat family protein n=1 Tax=Grimontia sp. NTOU-MAR1 TaxID=3111011 RepID=UPI002DB5CBC6|nr:sel1 repeat family protein [Grimontia sp. NTOU-MAR1]WRV99617.1 sel1 repeat family protein [Grimontia sp. NTOU-MAR1]
MKWLLPVLLVTITACSEETEFANASCPTLANYSDAFLESDFYRGWQHLQRGQYPTENCAGASPYFLRGVNDSAVFELSTLYIDFCSAPPQKDTLINSSIYHSEQLSNGVDYDEFKWVLDLALCNSPVEQYALGQMLFNGFITDKDIDKGIYFLSLAARQDHVQAQVALSSALRDIGESEVAAQWLAKAQGNGANILSNRGIPD